METTEHLVDHHRETVAAIRRASTIRVATATDRSYLAQISGVLCIAVGVMVPDPAVMVGVLAIGAAFLWAALHREDRSVDLDLDAQFDRTTGLPLAGALPVVLADDVAMRSLTGRIAIVTIDIPGVAIAEAAGEQLAARSLLMATTHRLRGQGWVDDASGPFGPLVFLRRPGVFIVVLRDVLDDRTTRWLADRIVRVIGAPVASQSEQLDPGATVGVAIGDTSNRHLLLAAANQARLEARRTGPGAVCVRGDDPTDALARIPRPVVAAGTTDEIGLEFDLEPSRSPQAALYFGLADFTRNLEHALSSTGEDDDGLHFVPISPIPLCRSDARRQILTMINEHRVHDRIALVVPSRVHGPGMQEAWRTLSVLRRCGLLVYVDHSEDPRNESDLPAGEYDGIVVTGDHRALIDAARRDHLDVVSRWLDHSLEADEPQPGEDDEDITALLGQVGVTDERLIRAGRETQVSTGRTVTARW